MKNHTAQYVIRKTGDETYRAYIPIKLLPPPPLDMTKLYAPLDKAMHGIGVFKVLHEFSFIPNPSLLLYMHVHKEALLSSQIEGTQSSFADLMLFENQQKTDIDIEDVEEVSNYVRAINYGLERLNDGFPLSLRLLREIHAILMDGTRGCTKSPGEFRRSQNWIGGARPSKALFVPPPPEKLMESLDDLEKFLHDERAKLPMLIKIAMVHVQFETIHPFLDGNGRLGRLLITLMLCSSGLIKEPILYLSLYLKQNRSTYYRLLQEVRMDGAWESWIEFFLDGISEASNQVLISSKAMHKVLADDFAKIQTLGRERFSCETVFEYMKKMPQVSAPALAKALSVSAPTARSALQSLEALGIVREITGKQTDRVYVYRKYLDILAEGTEPL